jgi:recombination DNA repair RAD52 pathway protein
MRSTRTIALALVAGAALLAGCAATPARHQETAAQKRAAKAHKAALLAAEYKQQYLADVTPMNNADDAFGKGNNRQNIRWYTRLASTEQSAAATMLRQQWPASAKADIAALATSLSEESGADYAVAGDFKIDPTAYSTRDKIYYTVSASSMGDDLQRESTDSDASTALAQKCRADLGLPPITG